MADKMKMLFLCTGNSCRSQMAEAWTNWLKGDQVEAYSAGVKPKGIDPRAVKAMAEAEIDISGQKSKDVDSLGDLQFDYVVTLCDNAKESCPFFPAKDPADCTMALTTRRDLRKIQGMKSRPCPINDAFGTRSRPLWRKCRGYLKTDRGSRKHLRADYICRSIKIRNRKTLLVRRATQHLLSLTEEKG